MGKIIFITGSAKSGKSGFAQEIAQSTGKKITFIATCGMRNDLEMKQRIKKHRLARPKSWKTIEEELNLSGAIKKSSFSNAIIVDCLTLWVSNLLGNGKNEKEITQKTKGVVSALNGIKSCVIFVSNEVGWGIVPDNKLARVFRDIAGRVNQIIAARSDEAYLMAAGIPVKLK